MRLDLVIVDIDDVFVYHRTVAAANQAFLRLVSGIAGEKLRDDFYTTRKAVFLLASLILFRFYRIKADRRLGKVLRLGAVAIRLYLLHLWREAVNRIFPVVSCRSMIRTWADAAVRLQIAERDYTIPERVLRKSIRRDAFSLYRSVAKRGLAISEHFAVHDDPMRRILGVEMMVSNRFIVRNGIISGHDIIVADGRDKKKIADEAIRRLRPKSVGIFISDYDDLGLLKIKNLSFVAYGRNLWRLIPGGILAVQI